MRRGWRGIPALLAAAVLAAAPHLAWAHAMPDRAEPRVGATVSAPKAVRIWFDGALEPLFSTIMVHDAKDRMVDKKDGRVSPGDATLLEVSVPPLPPGSYRVLWSVVGRDGHRTSGDYRFQVK